MTTRSGGAQADARKPRRYVNRALAYKVVANGKVEVYDLDFAAYCLMCGLVIGDMVEVGPPQASKNRGPAQFLFLFNDPDDKMAELSVDYTNSESARHADSVRRLKKAVRSTRVREC